jgi:hypothetical protein
MRFLWGRSCIFIYIFLILCLTTTPGQAVSGQSVATEARDILPPVYVKIAVGEEEFGQNFLHIFRFLPLALFHQFSIFTFVFTATLDKKISGRSLGSLQLEKCNLKIEQHQTKKVFYCFYSCFKTLKKAAIITRFKLNYLKRNLLVFPSIFILQSWESLRISPEDGSTNDIGISGLIRPHTPYVAWFRGIYVLWR